MGERIVVGAARVPPEEVGDLVPLLRQKNAALFLGVSVSYLRASDCPKVLLPGNGPKGRDIIRYDPAELRAWAAQRTTKRQKAS